MGDEISDDELEYFYECLRTSKYEIRQSINPETKGLTIDIIVQRPIKMIHISGVIDLGD